MIDSPQEYIEDLIAEKIIEAVKDYCDISKQEILNYIEEPPRPEFGDLALPVGRLRRHCKEMPIKNLMPKISSKISELDITYKVNVVSGYINSFLDKVQYSQIVMRSLKSLKGSYGKVSGIKSERIIVEYVSANPIHPLHVGSGRNAVLGEFVARALEFVGHKVQRRFYVDDVGRQVAILAFGYKLLGEPEPPKDMKVDYWFGYIYAVTHTLMDIIKLKKEVNELKRKGNVDELTFKLRELDGLMAMAARLRERDVKTFDKILDAINKVEDPEYEVMKLSREYERGELEAKRLVRKVINYVLKGFKETLGKLGIDFDKWDWESDLVWSGFVDKILEKAMKSPYFKFYKGVPALDFSYLTNDPLVRELLKIPKALEIPPLVLKRSDGTTLYTTRDIAYTIYKFEDYNADKVINVIASEQTLPQAQLRLALYALGYKEYAANLIHYSYEMVNLPGIKMSGRRGVYVTIDEVLERCMEKVRELLQSRGKEVSEDIVKDVTLAAFKFAMLSVSPGKPVLFNIDNVVNLERNSGPYLQYTYVRALSVLRKYGKDIEWDSISFDYVNENELIWGMVKFIGKFPKVVRRVSTYLDPEYLATYLLKLADKFNTFYDKEPIIGEKEEGRRQLKLALTYGVKTILKNGLYILGIPTPERM